MKYLKLFILPIMLFGLFIKPQTVYAGETEEEPTEEVVEAEEDEGLDIGDFLNADVITNIVSWLMSSGVLTFALSVLVKAKKITNYSTEELVEKFKDQIGGYLQEGLEKLSKEKLDEIKTTIDDLTASTETIMKVLVLMQDNTAKGKVALIDYLGAKTNSKEVEEAAKEVEEEIAKQEQAVAEAKEKVQDEYKEIF